MLIHCVRPAVWLSFWLVVLASANPVLGAKVRFQRQAVQIGDARQQDLDFELDVVNSLIQAQKIVESRQHKIQKNKQRQIRVLSVAEGQPNIAEVRYLRCDTTSEPGTPGAQTLIEPIASKAYRVERQGKTMLITYLDGKTPPAAELEWLGHDLQTFGQDNPLAVYLADRELNIGETIQLPPEVATELLGMPGSVGVVKKFQMQLAQLEDAQPAQLAKFQVSIELGGAQQGGIDMQLQGEMQIAPQNCQVQRMELSGPILSLEEIGEGEEKATFRTSGQMTVRANVTDLPAARPSPTARRNAPAKR